MKDNPLLKYSEQLATDIETLCKSLGRKDNSNTILQIRKSSSSVFANISEAQYPQSLPDMLSKIKLTEENLSEENAFFASYVANGTVLKAEFDGTTVLFVFQDNELFATAMYNENWSN